MKDVSWEQVLDTILGLKGLAQTREGNVITVMTLDKMKKGKEERVALDKARKAEADQLKPREDLITRVVPIAYNKPEKIKKSVEELQKESKDKDAKDDKDSKTASTPGSVTVDEHTRSLIIKDTPREMAGLLRFIESVDKPTAQIMIKANIIETTKDTARNLGIQWGGMWGQKIGSQGLYVTPGGTGGSTTPPGSAFSGGYTTAAGGAKGVAGQGFGVNFPAAMAGTASGSLGLIFGAIGENILELQLNALQKDGKLNILSSPSIMTMDNQEAITENGEEIPYVIPGTGSSVPTIQKTPAKLTLKIKPNVVEGKNIQMDIEVEKNEVDFSRQVQGNPVLITKKTKTN
jgi:type IV pilus assembly protein PilQ